MNTLQTKLTTLKYGELKAIISEIKNDTLVIGLNPEFVVEFCEEVELEIEERKSKFTLIIWWKKWKKKM